MKLAVWGMVMCFLCLATHVQGAGRIFTDIKGRSIEAEIVAYDEARNEVTLKRVGSNRPVTAPVSVFSEDDQKYILDWGRSQDFLGRHLKADISRLHKQDTERSRGTSASTEVYTDHSFKIEFNNDTRTAFENLDLEYVIYYEQEYHTNSGHDVEIKQGTLYHKEKFSLPEREVVEYTTEPVKLYTWKTYSLAPVDANMIGLRVRLILTPAFGDPVVREFVYPDHLDKAWVEKTNDAQRRVR